MDRGAPIDGTAPHAGTTLHAKGRMVKSQRCKYCAHDHGEHREALVNLESDPGEMVNLARDTKQHKVLAEYRQMLAE
jgi:arylsulfatase A-like enzyme